VAYSELKSTHYSCCVATIIRLTDSYIQPHLPNVPIFDIVAIVSVMIAHILFRVRCESCNTFWKQKHTFVSSRNNGKSWLNSGSFAYRIFYRWICANLCKLGDQIESIHTWLDSRIPIRADVCDWSMLYGFHDIVDRSLLHWHPAKRPVRVSQSHFTFRGGVSIADDNNWQPPPLHTTSNDTSQQTSICAAPPLIMFA